MQIAPASSDASHPSAAGTPPPLQSTSQLSPDDEALFRQLVRSHQGRLYRFIVKHIGWGSDAEDLTQQAFVEAARSYATFKGASELSTWLYGIAMNLVRNYLSRSPHRRYTFEGDDVLSETSCAPGVWAEVGSGACDIGNESRARNTGSIDSSRLGLGVSGSGSRVSRLGVV